MEDISSKSRLGVVLSELEAFSEHKVKLEQYTTPGEIVAEIVWDACLRNQITGKVILDSGCGSGILGLGALLMGASKVFFVDVNNEALTIARKNYNKLKKDYNIGEGVFVDDEIKNFNIRVDCVLQNPPFGTKEKHADKMFLETAFKVSDVIYSMHKLSTTKFVDAISEDFRYNVKLLHKINFPIKAIHDFHTKKKYNVEVGIWLLEK